MIPYLALGLCTTLSVVGASLDITTRRIPNWLCLVLAVSSAALAFNTGGIEQLTVTALHGVIALLIGMALFAAGWIGGGDAKFYAACALAIPLHAALAMLGWISIAGLGLLLVMVIARRTRSGAASVKKEQIMVPYGVAITIGFLATIFGQADLI